MQINRQFFECMTLFLVDFHRLKKLQITDNIQEASRILSV